MNKAKYSISQLSDDIKILTADAVEKAKSGHPGMPMGFSEVFTNLVFKYLKFNPKDPNWFGRDRLVLSAGHGSMLLYSFYYLAGYSDFSLEDIKKFRQLGAKTAGHPEHEAFLAIETTTGPLGQGLANAVGMAIAAKKYAAEIGDDLCDYKIYAIVGDGCLMEGVAYEALSLAGHLQLDNLIILFDDNNISIDGSTSLAVSEDHTTKMQAFGFNTYEADGHDDEQICSAFDAAILSKNKPSFISFKTIIGKGADGKAGTEKAHGAPLGSEEIKYLKSNIECSKQEFVITPEKKELWELAWEHNSQYYDDWQKKFQKISSDKRAFTEKKPLKIGAKSIDKPENAEASRVSSGRVAEHMLQINDKLIIGSADLAGSNGLNCPSAKAINAQNFSGNYIHYGVREHAMAAIMNGLALSGFSVLGGTFFVFSDYMRPSIRLAALMRQQTIYVLTHDSIGVGEDGPTHQPVEHLSSFRAMPNVNVFRPADYTETAECYEVAASYEHTPALMVLSRQSLPKLRGDDISDNKSAKGGYIISEAKDAEKLDKIIFATGSEVSLAIELQTKLQNGGMNIRVCSVPCLDILLQQPDEYIKSLKGNATQLVAIEAGCRFGWSELIGHDGLFFGINQFGASAPAKDLFKHFGLNVDDIYNGITETSS